MDKNGFIMKPVMTFLFYCLFHIIAYFLLTLALVSFYEFAAIVKAVQK